MSSRRQFLRAASGSVAAAAAVFDPSRLARIAEASAAVAGRPADEVARDEDFWREVQLAFTLDRTIINLNNGGVCPSPRVVHEALKRYLDISNQAPVLLHVAGARAGHRVGAHAAGRHARVRPRGSRHHAQRQRVAADLPARHRPRPGRRGRDDDQDYPRMLDTWEQRVRRDRIKLVKVPFPVPPKQSDLVVGRASAPHAAHEGHPHLPHHQPHRADLPGARDLRPGPRSAASAPSSTARTRSRTSRSRSRDLGCDYYGVSLHKWLLAPVGTGLLWMRRELIKDLWPLQPANVVADGQHPQVRGDRHAPGRHPQRDRRGHRVPRGHRDRTQGSRACATCATAGRGGWSSCPT